MYISIYYLTDEAQHIYEPQIRMDVPPQIEVLWRLLFDRATATSTNGNNSNNVCHHQTINGGGHGVASDFVDVVTALIAPLLPQLIDHPHHGHPGTDVGIVDPAAEPNSLSLAPVTLIALRELILATIEEEVCLRLLPYHIHTLLSSKMYK